jgi:hypothetical protein
LQKAYILSPGSPRFRSGCLLVPVVPGKISTSPIVWIVHLALKASYYPAEEEHCADIKRSPVTHCVRVS